VRQNRIALWAAPILALAAIAWPALAPRKVHAQIDPLKNPMTIWQNGQQVGMIFSPPDVGNRGLYLEHWILFPNYVYPSEAHQIRTDIVPNTALAYATEDEFFRAAPWGAGYRYVKVTAHDSTRLPAAVAVKR
jgi:hypothetical protein